MWWYVTLCQLNKSVRHVTMSSKVYVVTCNSMSTKQKC
jgi:hypothetical protein